MHTHFAIDPPPARGPLVGLLFVASLLLAAVVGLAGSSSAVGLAGFDVGVQRFHWPLAPPHPVLRPFQAPSTPYGPGHRGVDLGGRLG
ncbi:MAG TPA: M23 family peptidase, partial [Pseudonocardiaceae bacterium]|nr:M23 family peptidase [Pseudonocardiaceae bacterium]